MSDDHISWFVIGRTLEEVAEYVKRDNYRAWVERYRRRRNPVGCYEHDALDELVGV